MINVLRRVRAGHAGADRGQGSLQYVAMLAVAALMVTMIAIAGLGGQVEALVQQALCSLTQQRSCAAPDRSPYERALTGRYLAMGDSFASGEGAWDYEEGTDFDNRDDPWPFNHHEEDHNRCHRSANAYSHRLAADNEFAGGNQFVACSGSLIADFRHPNHKETGEDPQLAALGDDTSLVTLSVGGNDLGFAKILTDCVTSNLRLGAVDCRKLHDRRVADELPRIEAELAALYRQVRQDAPNARVIVVGYPPLFAEEPAPNVRNLLRAQDQAWMNGLAADLNATIASAAGKAGVEYVDPTATFRGHGIGTEDPWFNDLTPKGPGMMPINPGSFHPNAKGQAALAGLIQRQLEDPR